MLQSGDGRGNRTTTEESQGKKNKKAEELVAEAHRSSMLTTLSQKRDYQVAMLALNKHDKEEEEKEQGESTSQSGPSSKAVKREAKVESLKDKRRKIRDRGEHLDSQLAEEGNRITEILEQVASALLSPPRHSAPITISKASARISLCAWCAGCV